MSKRVIVGLSGGVDSSVAALLLQQQGYDVHGVFMKNWQDDFEAGICSAEEDLRDARTVCEVLGIPLHTVEFIEQYRQKVFNEFLKEYSAGRTPNPDILCNKEIKFKAFLDHADNLGADFIATGHHARLHRKNATSHLLKGLDPEKDQSYFLYALNQQQLRRVLFPIGIYQKPHVREMAEQAGLLTHDKKDSTGICFIGERDFKAFLGHYLEPSPGTIKTPEGDVVGQHNGLMFYTLGQRQGLGIGGRSHSTGEPWYVVDKQFADNILVVAQGDHPLLYSRELITEETHWIAAPPELPLRCRAKTRYRQADQDCRVEYLTEGICRVQFDHPQRAITPGQSVVFYSGDECIGGAIINHVNH